MQTPNPLPEPGWWLVINGDELYEVGHCKGTDNHGARVWCSTLPDDAGVYYWSVNEGEAIWTPWDDPSVSAVLPTLAEAEAYIDAHRKPLAAAFVLGQVGAYALRTPPRAPEPPDDDPDRRPCTFGDAAGTPCGDGPDAHEWHHDGTHTYE